MARVVRRVHLTKTVHHRGETRGFPREEVDIPTGRLEPLCSRAGFIPGQRQILRRLSHDQHARTDGRPRCR